MKYEQKMKRRLNHKRVIPCAILVITALIMISSPFFSSAEVEQNYREVTVVRGDTLWGIASELDAGRDIRELIFDIRQINNLDSSDLREGQVLLVPVAP